MNLKGVWLCMKYEIQQMLGWLAAVRSSTRAQPLLWLAQRNSPPTPRQSMVSLGDEFAALDYADQGIRVTSFRPAQLGRR